MLNDTVKGTDIQVQLIDPNNVNININPSFPNGIAEYQDMFIFAELTAKRKGRTVITVNEDVKNDKYVTVNFIGNNQNVDKTKDMFNDPDRLNFTTNYYQGSHSGNEQFESFGMTSIKVSVNSSYVPQVSIQFVDIRGLSFFNQTDSKYRIIFDFPPPLFRLTIKGYYGKALTYDLHLVKYTTEFKAENGNFVIDAQFVGMTFAPLTDVLFRYIVNAPLIKWNGETALPAVGEPPSNTNDFIVKLKSLYSALNTEAHNTDDNEKFTKSANALKANESVMFALENYSSVLNAGGVQSYMFTPTNRGIQAKKLNSLAEYDTIRLASIAEADGKPNAKLYIGYLRNVKNGAVLKAQLSKYKDNMLKNSNVSIALDVSPSNNDIGGPSILASFTNITTTPPIELPRDGTTNPKDFFLYAFIDVTEFYSKLITAKENKTQEKDELSNVLRTNINATIFGHLGMQPTIKNVFKLLCKDVDEFFSIVRAASIKAENNYAKDNYKKIIVDYIKPTNSDYIDTIFAFPLVVEDQTTKGIDGTNGVTSQVRIAPVELNKTLTAAGEEMPEMRLVYDFIDSFVKQRKINQITALREQTLQDGTFVWIPICPIDAAIANTNANSPYARTTDNITISSNDDLYSILLDRFYILSQYAIFTKYYQKVTYPWYMPDLKQVSDAYIDMYARAEANNIYISQTSPKIIEKLVFDSNLYSNNIQLFYDYLNASTTIKNYNFSDNKIDNINNVYLDRTKSEYKGLNLYYGEVELLTGSEITPLGLFAKEVQRTKVVEFFYNVLPESEFEFSTQNLIYLSDSYKVANNELKGSEDKEDKYIDETQVSINLTTRFLAKDWSISVMLLSSPYEVVAHMLNHGNSGFTTMNAWTKAMSWGKNNFIAPWYLNGFTNVINIWVDILGRTDTLIYDEIIDSTQPISIDGKYDAHLSATVFASNFGLTLSPFNQYPKALNALMFQTPAIVEIPFFLAAYIGGIVYAIKHDILKDFVAFFIKHAPNGDGLPGNCSETINSMGIYFFADYHDVKTYMSEQDKQLFLTFYEITYLPVHKKMIDGINTAYKEAQKVVVTGDVSEEYNRNGTVKAKKAVYNRLLNPKIDGNVNIDANLFTITFSEFLSHNVKLVVFSENTFRIGPLPATTSKTYTSLAHSNAEHSNTFKPNNDKFFKSFFIHLKSLIDKKAADTIKEEEEQKKLTSDKDIVTQMYYSFKNINDKWLTYPSHDYATDKGGYPYAPAGQEFIESFAFVDRTMNDISDTVINPETLIEAFNDTDTNVYSVMSKLLSVNGFLFFPLQNFMTHTWKSWEDTFKITPNVGYDTVASFICMYAGGSSSYPSDISGSKSGFKDDGMDDVRDLAKGGNPSENSVDDNSPWRKVKAFNVKFGQQNQSMFTDMKIDSKEFPETNESIQILARLAGDEKNNAPVQKGQNLYNLYENRAYKATITGLGNAMIQPTQYFQLDNVPLYNGAYLILGVEHNITANKMTTQFSGTKILRFPVPRVLDAAAVMGFGGDPASNAQAAGSVTTGKPIGGRANAWNGYPFNGKPAWYKMTDAVCKTLLHNAILSEYSEDLKKSAFIVMYTEQHSGAQFGAFEHDYAGVRTISSWKHAKEFASGIYQHYVDNSKEEAGYYEYVAFKSDLDFLRFFLPTLKDKKFTAVSADAYANAYALYWYGSVKGSQRYTDGYTAGKNAYNRASPIWDKL